MSNRRVAGRRAQIVLAGLSALALGGSITRAGGIEFFGTSTVTSDNLIVSFNLDGGPREYLIGTYTNGSQTTPLGISPNAGMNSTLRLFDASGQIASSTDLVSNIDAEIHSTGRTGRGGAAVTGPLAVGDYTVYLGRQSGTNPLAAALAINVTGAVTVTGISKPQPNGFTLTDVLVNASNSAATLALAGYDLTVATSAAAEAGGVIAIGGGTQTFGTLAARTTGRIVITGGTVTATAINTSYVSSNGFLDLSDGSVNTGALQMGTTSGFAGTATQTGGSLTVSGATTIGNTTASPLSVYNLIGGTLSTDTLTFANSGRLNLLGGELSVSSASSITNSSGRLTWTSGTLHLRNVATTLGLGSLFGTSLDLAPGKTLVADVAAPFDIPVRLEGGALTLPTIAAGSPLTLDAGRLTLTSGIPVDAGTFLGSHLTLKPGLTIAGPFVNNHGVIDGNGTMAASLLNNTGGEVRADAGSTLRFDSTGMHTNKSRLTLNGGRLDLAGPLENDAAGDITGRGAIVATSIHNVGDLALSGGTSDVYATFTNAPGGRVVLSGNSNTSFWGDVSNQAGASFRVSPGSVATFLGTYGGGSITGGGSVYFEADVTPGFSPALVNIGGSLAFGPSSKLEIELAGTNRGSQYDAIDAGGPVLINGTLDLTLLDGFVPASMNQFTILSTTGTLTGTFTRVDGILVAPTKALAVTYDAQHIYVTATLPGDADVNGTVDFNDLLTLAKHYNQGDAIWASGDFNGDANVSFDDLLSLAKNYNKTATGSFAEDWALAQSLVPEPTAIGVLGMIVLPRRRRDTVAGAKASC